MSMFRSHIKSLGLSVPKFARQIGRSPQYLYELDTGRRLPSLEVARDIELATSGAIPMHYWLPNERAELERRHLASPIASDVSNNPQDGNNV